MEKLFNEPYKDGLTELISYYSGLKNIKSLILKFQSIRSVVEAYYQVLVNHKELDEIGTLQEPEKSRIWKLTEGLEKGERVKASRAIYLMDKIQQP